MIWNLILQSIVEYWPTIVVAFAGLLACILTYITAKLKAKTKEAELKAANAQLRTAIINGSYIICPDCGKEIYLKDTKIFTKGDNV